MVAFRCYDPSANRGGGIHGWYDGLNPRFRAEIDTALELLGLEDSFDGVDAVKPLRGACEGLTEIIIEFEQDEIEIHIRILGFDGPGRKEFTLLLGFEKTNNDAIYGPHCRAAHARKAGVIRDGRRAPECRFP